MQSPDTQAAKPFQIMTNNIYPCLWFDGLAKSAATFYCGFFPDARITTDTPMVVNFELFGKKIMGLNGGPVFKINPSISFFVYCHSEEEAAFFWQQLSREGNILLPFEDYPWSEKYGWVADQFGVSWQVMYSEEQAARHRIVPSMLFSGEQYGHAYEAIEFYTQVFPKSYIRSANFYEAEDRQPEGNLALAYFSLHNTDFTAMDGGGRHQFAFNEGVSLVVNCENQDEIDHYWQQLSAGGSECNCGWLKDRFGVSWQIVPQQLGSLVNHPQHGKAVGQALMQMKKIDLTQLNAIAGH